MFVKHSFSFDLKKFFTVIEKYAICHFIKSDFENFSLFFFDKTVSAYVCFDLVNSYCVVVRVENSSSSNSGIMKIYWIYFFV